MVVEWGYVAARGGWDRERDRELGKEDPSYMNPPNQFFFLIRNPPNHWRQRNHSHRRENWNNYKSRYRPKYKRHMPCFGERKYWFLTSRNRMEKRMNRLWPSRTNYRNKFSAQNQIFFNPMREYIMLVLLDFAFFFRYPTMFCFLYASACLALVFCFFIGISKRTQKTKKKKRCSFKVELPHLLSILDSCLNCNSVPISGFWVGGLRVVPVIQIPYLFLPFLGN